MGVDVILGLQWGDEGKGKIVDCLADQYDMVCRFQGGPNAGHTIIIGKDKYVLHTIPSGIFRKGMINLIGNGVVVDPITLKREIEGLLPSIPDLFDRLFVSKKAHLILPSHRYLDAASEASKGTNKIGSTLKGIGPTYMDKTGRNGLRIGDILRPDFEYKYNILKQKHLGLIKLYPDIEFQLNEEEEKWFDCIEYIKKISQVQGEYFVNRAIDEGKRILAEGAQGSMLDIDFGTYPFVTSSNTISAGVCSGLGIAPNKIKDVIGITKAYCTRVGSGPFPTELNDDQGQKLRDIGREYGATTGRPRRCGWIDIPQLRYTIMLNGVTKLCITKLDVLNEFESFYSCDSYQVDGVETDELPFEITEINVIPNYTEIKGWNRDLDNVKSFENLPQAAINYLNNLEEKLNTRINLISKGPERDQLIFR